MTSVRSRENTFKVDLSVFPKRPSFEDIHTFVHQTVGLRTSQVKRLQMNHVLNVAYVKCDSLKTAQDAVDQHNDRHEMEVNNEKYKVRLQMDDAAVDVKIHDLSENVGDEEIVTFLRQYGEVHSLKELMWGDNFAFKGISSGIRVARMTLKKHIKSFVTIQQEQTLITYRQQPLTCRHCSNPSHPGITCAENKKLSGQKVDLDARLKKAQSSTSSYANVLVKGTDVINSLLPKFVATNLNQLKQTAVIPKTDGRVVLPPKAIYLQPSNAADGGEGPSSLSALANPSSSLNDIVVIDQSAAEKTTTAAGDDQSVMEQMDQSTQQTDEDGTPQLIVATTESVSTFKIPTQPFPSKTVHSEISESDESSSESLGFQQVRRGRGRPKKLKTDSDLNNTNILTN